MSGIGLRYGIILRSLMPDKQKCILFDQKMGMMEVVIARHKVAMQVSHGILLRYTIRERGRNYIIDDVVVIAQPAYWVMSDIFFLHHVLEVAQNFLVYHDAGHDLFKHFIKLFRPLDSEFEKLEQADFKQLYLCRFFCLVGIYPENNASFSPTFFRLISSSIDIMVKAQKGVLNHSEVARWLQGCIAVHPYADRFKTTIFLTQMDGYEA